MTDGQTDGQNRDNSVFSVGKCAKNGAVMLLRCVVTLYPIWFIANRVINNYRNADNCLKQTVEQLSDEHLHWAHQKYVYGLAICL